MACTITRRRLRHTTGIVALCSALLAGCASSPVQERDARRAELDAMAEETVASLLETQPHASETLSRCVGYVVIDMQVAKIPIFGAGGGPGVVVDRRTNARSYIKVSRFEIGSGMGSQKFKVIIVFDDPELFERAASGAWHYDAGAEMAAGTTAAESAVNREGSGYHAYKIIESGAVAAVTVRLARAKPYLQ